jgi:flagellar biosynthetic protein FliQ
MDMLVREAAQVLATVGAPFIMGLLAVGTTVGVLQAATQVNDPALGAVPRLGVAVGLAVSLGGWVAENLAGFLARSLEQLANGP